MIFLFLFAFYCKYYSLINTSQPQFDFLHSSQLSLSSLLSYIQSCSIHLQKRADLQKAVRKYNTTKDNKTRQKPLHQDWTKQPNRRKIVPRIGKRARKTHLLSQLGLPQNTYTTTQQPEVICRGSDIEPCKPHTFHFSVCEPE